MPASLSSPLPPPPYTDLALLPCDTRRAARVPSCSQTYQHCSQPASHGSCHCLPRGEGEIKAKLHILMMDNDNTYLWPMMMFQVLLIWHKKALFSLVADNARGLLLTTMPSTSKKDASSLPGTTATAGGQLHQSSTASTMQDLSMSSYTTMSSGLPAMLLMSSLRGGGGGRVKRKGRKKVVTAADQIPDESKSAEYKGFEAFLMANHGMLLLTCVLLRTCHLSASCTHTHTHTLTHSLSLTHTHTLTLACTLTLQPPPPPLRTLISLDRKTLSSCMLS